MEKNKVKINKVTVPGPPFHGESFVPTNVNFLFGKNGSGKSTISRAIRDGIGLSWVNDPGNATTIQVFNEDYIKFNIEGEMNGIFTISAPDIETEKQIKEKTEEQEKNKQAITAKREEAVKNESRFSDIKNNVYAGCWSITRSFLKEFTHNPTNGGNKEKFFNQISEITPKEHSLDELKDLERAAYDKTLKHVNPFEPVLIRKLDTSILSTPIVALEETQFSLFMKEMGPEVTDWVYKGLKRFQPLAKGKCPYCQEDLSLEKQTAIEQAFDDSYTRAVECFRKLKEDLLPRYEVYIQTIIKGIKEKEGFEFVNKEKFELTEQKFISYLQVLKNTINEKELSLSKKMNVEDISPLIKELNDLLSETNSAIEKRNSLITTGDKKGAYEQALKEQLAYLCEAAIKDYKAQREEYLRVKDLTDKELKAFEFNSNRLKESLKELHAKTTSTLPVISKINNLLTASGFNSFSISPAGKRSYKLVRPDNSDAKFLSEGEKNFICFLYFYYSVCGVLDEDAGYDDRVVVIDDPVSSMDSDSVFIIAELVREIVDATLNAFNPVKEDGVPTNIKQLFVLTHNAFFYNEVAPMYLDFYENVSYFEIQKEDTHSRVELNTKSINKGAINEKEINFIPDLGNYSSLWEIYNTTTNPRLLMNTMRRILEEYFLHNLGYAPRNFKGQILSAVKGEFQDATDKILARALVNYVSNDEISSINFSTYTTDIIKLKTVFERVFDIAGQKQHYDMMLNR